MTKRKMIAYELIGLSLMLLAGWFCQIDPLLAVVMAYFGGGFVARGMNYFWPETRIPPWLEKRLDEITDPAWKIDTSDIPEQDFSNGVRGKFFRRHKAPDRHRSNG